MARRNKPKHGSLYKAAGRYYLKVKLPGTEKIGSYALREPTKKQATTDRRMAIALADAMWERRENEITNWSSGYDGTIPKLLDLFIEDREIAITDRAKVVQEKNLSLCRAAIADLIEFLNSKETFSLVTAELKPNRVELWRTWLHRKKKVCRTTINKKVGIVKQMLDYAARNELEPVDLAYRISLIKPLKKGEEDFKDYEEVEPADWDEVQKLFPYIPEMIQDMLTICRYTGARPGEVRIIRPCDIDRTDPDAWNYRPSRHKTEKHGIEREIAIGPHAQKVLQKYLIRRKTDYCFPPPQNSLGTAGKHYTSSSFSRLISRAVDAYNKDHPKKKLKFHANQLRHTFGTEACSTYGINFAQHSLGHTTEAMTKRYTKNALREDARRKAAEVAKKLG